MITEVKKPCVLRGAAKSDHRTLSDVSHVCRGAVRWGSFDVIFAGRNSAGTETTFTIAIPWMLWPLIVSYAALAWLREKEMREAEIKTIDKTFNGGKAA